MNELSLFTGAGGGLLGSILLGWHPIGYVEWDDYCQRVIAARIKDGILPDAPIFGNIKTFISEGYAASYQGLVDVITSGFPCQPFSVAGKRKGADDERNMWPSTAECIGIVRPRFVLLENVPGIRTYLPVVVRDLRRLGYEVSRPLILGADDVGAPHRRKRVWIVASNAQDSINGRNGRWSDGDKAGGKRALQIKGSDRHAPNADETGREEQRRSESVREEHTPAECGDWSEPWPEVAARICRVSYGLADWLVENWRRVNHGAVKTISRQDVSDLWEAFQSSEVQRNFGRCYPLLKTEDVFAVLRQLKAESDKQDDVSFEGAAIQRNCMRVVFIPCQFGCASQRREYQEQRSRELGDTLPPLSHEIALATESIVWWYGCETDISNRVDRLKALGNGQVPQCMATAFRILTGQIQGLL